MYPTPPSLEYSTAMYPPLLVPLLECVGRRLPTMTAARRRSWLLVQPADDDGLLLQVVLDGLLAVLAAYAGFLHAAEGQLVVAEVELVHPRHAGLYLLRGPVDPLHVVSKDGGAQAVGRVVGEPHRLVRVVDLPDGQERPERLLTHHPAVVGGVLDDGRLEEVALAVAIAPAHGDLRAAADGVLELVGDQVPVPRGVEGAHPYLRLLRLLHPVAELVAGDPLGDSLHELVVDLAEDVDAFGREARLARVEEPPDVDAPHRGVHVRVGEDYDGVGAAELGGDALELGGGDLHEPAPHLGAAGEGHPADVRVGGERLPDLLAGARHDVNDAR